MRGETDVTVARAQEGREASEGREESLEREEVSATIGTED